MAATLTMAGCSTPDPGPRTTGIGPEGVQYLAHTADHPGSLGFLP
jgi:hypothetical protein